MNYLRTNREDKGTFVMMIGCLLVMATQSIRVDTKILFHSNWYNYEPSGWKVFFVIVGTIIQIAFLNMLKNGLPHGKKYVGSIVTAFIVFEVIGCFLAAVLQIVPVTFLLALFQLLISVILGMRLKDKYQGKIKTLGSYFIIYPITSVVCLIISSGLWIGIVTGFIDKDNVFLEILFILVYGVGVICIYVVPWSYEAKLLIEGTKYFDIGADDFEEEFSKSTENIVQQKDTVKSDLRDLSEASEKQKVGSHQLTFNNLDYLRTSREGKGIFKFMLWILGLAAFCESASDMGLFQNVKGHNWKLEFLKFMTENIPTPIWTIIGYAITIVFLFMLRNGLPDKGKAVKTVTLSLIIIEVVCCVLSIFRTFLPEVETMELPLLISSISLMILYFLLGCKLRKNYQGKIRRLGRYFQVCSAVLMIFAILSISIIVLSSAGGEDDYYDYDNAAQLWEVSITIITVVAVTLLDILPWIYEAQLLMAGTEHCNDTKEESTESAVDIIRQEEPIKADFLVVSEVSGEIQVDSNYPTDVSNSQIESAIKRPEVDVPKVKEKLSGSYKANRKVIGLILAGCLLAIVIISVVRILQSNTNKSSKNLEIIMGDFDGDGEYERLWVEGDFDEDGYAETLVIKSDNPKFDGLAIGQCYGVSLYPLIGLGLYGEDLLGLVAQHPSNWEMYSVLRFNGREWVEAIESFTIFDEAENRVRKSDIPGCVVIVENDMADIEYGFKNTYRTVRLEY